MVLPYIAKYAGYEEATKTPIVGGLPACITNEILRHL